jgi:BirA family biotin operon repressor/biotin-[acetyl-CoA-carboxylase] ligase
MTSIAVFELLSDLFKIRADIKWSNDVHVNDKKISGILAETVETNKGLAVVVGIGLNLKSKNFPNELKETATSIEQETNLEPEIDELLKSLTKLLNHYYSIIQNENGPRIIRDEWAKRSSYFNGKEVRVILENETIYGTTCGLEENGALKIRMDNNQIRVIQAGDVEKLRQS